MDKTFISPSFKIPLYLMFTNGHSYIMISVLILSYALTCLTKFLALANLVKSVIKAPGNLPPDYTPEKSNKLT